MHVFTEANCSLDNRVTHPPPSFAVAVSSHQRQLNLRGHFTPLQQCFVFISTFSYRIPNLKYVQATPAAVYRNGTCFPPRELYVGDLPMSGIFHFLPHVLRIGREDNCKRDLIIYIHGWLSESCPKENSRLLFQRRILMDVCSWRRMGHCPLAC